MNVKENSTSPITPIWFGLGANKCFGNTCKFGEFCSESLLYRTCRQCSDIIAWCDVNKTHLALNYPSCYHICAEKYKEELQAQLNETRNTLQTLEGRVTTGPTLDISHYTLIAVIGVLFLLLVFVGVYILTKTRPSRSLSTAPHWLPGQKAKHTTLKAQESTGLLPADVEQNEDPRPAYPLTATTTNTTPSDNQAPHTQTLTNDLPEEPQDTRHEGGDSPEPPTPAHYATLSTDHPSSTSSHTSTATIPNDLGEAATLEQLTGPQTGFCIPASGFSPVQSEAPLLNRGSGCWMYPVRVGDEEERSPKMALGSNTYNTDVLFAKV